jgi:hypothetical protein
MIDPARRSLFWSNKLGCSSKPLAQVFRRYKFAVACAGVLPEGGAIVDVTNKFGNTPLFTATFNCNGDGEMIASLREFGADTHHVNHDGQSPVGSPDSSPTMTSLSSLRTASRSQNERCTAGAEPLLRSQCGLGAKC